LDGEKFGEIRQLARERLLFALYYDEMWSNIILTVK
jgi:hypothetical protein